MPKPDPIDLIIEAALHEDVGGKDITTSALIPPNLRVKADIQVKESGVLCGLDIAEKVFRHVDAELRFLPVARDGEPLDEGREIAYIDGHATSVLIGERTALNFLSHLSGIATHTRQFVDKVKGSGVKILDTRKTTPNLRILEKYAVTVGGGTSHRRGLYDQALIKDNHLRILRKEKLVDIIASVKRSVLKNVVVGVEVKNIAELKEALKSKADYILLDNMTTETVKEAVDCRKKAGVKIDLEVSGGITLDNVLSYAQTGIERISIGALTHHIQGLDVSLDIVS